MNKILRIFELHQGEGEKETVLENVVRIVITITLKAKKQEVFTTSKRSFCNYRLPGCSTKMQIR